MINSMLIGYSFIIIFYGFRAGCLGCRFWLSRRKFIGILWIVVIRSFDFINQATDQILIFINK